MAGLLVAISWAFIIYLERINVQTDIGLLIESLYILPIALIVFYMIIDKGVNDFNLEDPSLMLFLTLAGPMTVIPLFLYVRGVELCGLGPTGMVFYITPTLQFLLGFFIIMKNFQQLNLLVLLLYGLLYLFT